MKKHLLILFVFLVFGQLRSQVVFCPPGAEWKYIFRPGVGNYAYYANMHYLRDSLLNAETVKVLGYGHFFKVTVGDRCSNVLLKQNGDTIFMRNCNTRNTWQVLYNFAATAGQSWTTTLIDSMASGTHVPFTHTITVNTVTTVVMNNMTLKKLLVSYCYTSPYTGTVQCDAAEIIERIGCTTYLFNYTHKMNVSDPDGMSDFLCYTDNTFGTSQFSQKGCNYDVGIAENKAAIENVVLYPQPAGDRLHVVFSEHAAGLDYALQVTDLLGRAVPNARLQLSGAAGELDLSTLPKGIYFLRFFDGSSPIATRKFIKE